MCTGSMTLRLSRALAPLLPPTRSPTAVVRGFNVNKPVRLLSASSSVHSAELNLQPGVSFHMQVYLLLFLNRSHDLRLHFSVCEPTGSLIRVCSMSRLRIPWYISTKYASSTQTKRSRPLGILRNWPCVLRLRSICRK